MSHLEAAGMVGRIIRRYNQERLHSALDFLGPVVCCRGRPEESTEGRRNAEQ